jgi:hypothetical protein
VYASIAASKSFAASAALPAAFSAGFLSCKPPTGYGTSRPAQPRTHAAIIIIARMHNGPFAAFAVGARLRSRSVAFSVQGMLCAAVAVRHRQTSSVSCPTVVEGLIEGGTVQRSAGGLPAQPEFFFSKKRKGIYSAENKPTKLELSPTEPSESCRFLSFSFESFITPTFINRFYL